ncbi:MAG: NADPH cytochrome P450 oxidoreductase family protein [Pseudomonadota bacterium]
MSTTLILHATQTGCAEDFAETLRERMEEESLPVEMMCMSEASVDDLNTAQRIIFFAATTGDGDPPFMVEEAVDEWMTDPLDLSGRAVLTMALGDKQYEQFAAFGQRVHAWATESQASTELVLIDNLDIDDLEEWDQLLESHALPPISRTRKAQALNWKITECSLVAEGNPDRAKESWAAGLYRVKVKPDGEMPAYAVGDLFEWCDPDGTRRDFSIASIPSDEELDLFVRRVELASGGMGRGSEALTSQDVGAGIAGRMKKYGVFHRTTGSGPLIAVAAGSGWGGIRAHILDAIVSKRPVWLFYGDRGPEPDLPLFAEMREWADSGAIQRFDLALSRTEGDGPRYVQEAVAARAGELAEFLGPQGAVITCGATAMGDAVRTELKNALSADWITGAKAQSRWREALY